MIKLFDPENKFWQFMGKLTDVACMSFLWVLTSLPLFTIGASTAAFYRFTLRQVSNTEGGVWKGYFSAFKACFKKATLLWLIQLAGTAFFAVDLWAAWNFFLVQGGAAGIMVLGLCGCCAILFLSCCFYVYPTLAQFDFPLKKLLSNSFVMAVGNLPVTITLLVMTLLVCVAIFYLSGLFFFWIGLFIFFSSYFIYGVFLKYAVGEEEPAADPADSDAALPEEDEKWLV